jgi:predicted RNA-binding protein (virulence factor B family)
MYQVIFDLLVEYDGELPFWDKSSPEAIKEVFNMSKGSFKRAIENGSSPSYSTNKSKMT